MVYAKIRKILVVDADDRDRLALRGHLEHHGYVVEATTNATDAIRMGLVLEPHVVLSEIWLAEHTRGDQIFDALRRHLPGLATVLVTADADDADRARYRALGIDAIFDKPLKRERLDEYLHHHFANLERAEEGDTE